MVKVLINITMVITSESCTDGKYDISSLLTRLEKVVTILFKAQFIYLFIFSISAIADHAIVIIVSVVNVQWTFICLPDCVSVFKGAWWTPRSHVQFAVVSISRWKRLLLGDLQVATVCSWKVALGLQTSWISKWIVIFWFLIRSTLFWPSYFVLIKVWRCNSWPTT